jgi:3-oxoadipate enol-lactonase
MPFTGAIGRRIYWKLEGPEGAPVLVLLNSIGTDMDLWDRVLPLLRPAYQLLRIDTRGHGASDVVNGDYALADLADDIFEVMDAAGVDTASVSGVSLGGMIAMEMALAKPSRIVALALVCTSATMDKGAWDDRVAKVRSEGMAGIADLVMGRFLAPEFIASEPAVAQSIRRQLLSQSAAGYAGCGAAIRDMDLAVRVKNIACPTLVVTGDFDTSTPLEGHGEYLLATIPNAQHAALPAAHLAPIDAPLLLADTIAAFLKV